MNAEGERVLCFSRRKRSQNDQICAAGTDGRVESDQIRAARTDEAAKRSNLYSWDGFGTQVRVTANPARSARILRKPANAAAI